MTHKQKEEQAEQASCLSNRRLEKWAGPMLRQGSGVMSCF